MTTTNQPTPYVVYIEDDEKLARLTSKYLEHHGVRVTWVDNPREGIACVFREQPDVVLLDLMLPEIDGIGVCKALRERVDTPIIMVTARDGEQDLVQGLEEGADDYIVKPFSARELLARIRAQTRRRRGDLKPTPDQLSASGVVFDFDQSSVTFLGQELTLTTYEYELLRVFVSRAGQPLTREQLIDLVRGNAEEAFDRSIDVHISNLRKKLGDDARKPRRLKTVRGVGYQFVKGVES